MINKYMIGKLLSKNAPNSNKKFHIIVPTYNGGTKLEVFINCFLSQTCLDFHLSIISDGPEPITKVQMEKYNEFENISYYELDRRYNDYGHTPREFGLGLSDCKYTIMSGFDNYYVPEFIERFNDTDLKSERVGFIYCDFLLDHIRSGIRYNGHMDAKIQCDQIDIGCYACITSVAKQVGFKFRSFAADWEFVAAAVPMLKTNNFNIIKIPQTLYVHN